MAWHLSGQLIESCSCNMMCPCWFGVPTLAVQDQGWCASAIGLRIERGESDGLDLSGRVVVFVPDFPDMMFAGNGVARLYLDDTASADQRRELEAICSGAKGGPMGALGPLIATWLPAQVASISIHDEGDAITVSVGDFGEVRSARLRDGGGQGFTMQGGGFVAGLGMESVELAPSSSRWSDPELPRSFETKSGARGAFTWSG